MKHCWPWLLLTRATTISQMRRLSDNYVLRYFHWSARDCLFPRFPSFIYGPGVQWTRRLWFLLRRFCWIPVQYLAPGSRRSNCSTFCSFACVFEYLLSRSVTTFTTWVPAFARFLPLSSGPIFRFTSVSVGTVLFLKITPILSHQRVHSPRVLLNLELCNYKVLRLHALHFSGSKSLTHLKGERLSLSSASFCIRNSGLNLNFCRWPVWLSHMMVRCLGVSS